jgi:heme/copper-type cytochrome/quinol oxidase subunit 3
VGVAAVTLYWHFVDVVWFFLFAILYVGVAYQL